MAVAHMRTLGAVDEAGPSPFLTCMAGAAHWLFSATALTQTLERDVALCYLSWGLGAW